jgi:molybdate transport system permease protein
MDPGPLFLSLKLASITTGLLLVAGIPLSRWIGLSRTWKSRAARAAVQVPMVLPPTVVGFYLLVLFAPGSGLGQFLRQRLGVELLFHFPGLVVASLVSTLPFLTTPVIAGFQSLPPRYREASLCLGRSPWTTFWKLEVPLVLPSIVAGAILSFLHVLGEFGVVLMIGGKIPGETNTVSIQLFDMVEQMDYPSAHRLALALAVFAFSGLVALFALQERGRK